MAAKLENKLEDVNANDQWVWFHASSLGEFEQGRPLIESIKSAFPGYKILLTFFRLRVTKSGKTMQLSIKSCICQPTHLEMPDC